MAQAGTADERLIADALAQARAAGVDEREIARLLRASAAEPDDALRAPVLAGRLLVLAREAGRAET
jgi:hypothetical protein